MHAGIHAYMHSRVHACLRECVNTCICARMCMCMCIRALMRNHIHIRTPYSARLLGRQLATWSASRSAWSLALDPRPLPTSHLHRRTQTYARALVHARILTPKCADSLTHFGYPTSNNAARRLPHFGGCTRLDLNWSVLRSLPMSLDRW